MIPNTDLRAVTDEDLAARLVRGDPAAFEALVDRHEPRIRLLCWRITGSPRESEDLTQEVFLRVYRHRDTYRSDRPFRQWLNRICVNVCSSHQKRLRLSGVRLVALDEAQDAPGAPGGPAPLSPEAHAQMSDGVRTVQAALARLTEPFRSTLILRVFGELSYQEIAEALGCSLGTVMSRVNRARNLVKDQLKDLP